MLIALCSVKSSPGVTTTAVALAARWPDADPLLVEADPAGGDLAARFGLPATPGLVTLAAAARRSRDPALLAEHCQALRGGLRVVLGPLAADRARAALTVLGSRGRDVVPAASSDPGSVVLLDVGRVDPASPAVPLLREADVLLLVARPRAEDLSHAATLLGVMPTWSRRPGLVLVGPGYSRAEIERELGIAVMAALPHDPRGADILCGRARGRMSLRSALGPAAARLAEQIRTHIAAVPRSPETDHAGQHTEPVEPERSVDVSHSPAHSAMRLPDQRVSRTATGAATVNEVAPNRTVHR